MVELIGAPFEREDVPVAREAGRVVSQDDRGLRGALRAFERDLRAGTRLVITISRPGFITKTSRRGRPPIRTDECLAPGARTPSA